MGSHAQLVAFRVQSDGGQGGARADEAPLVFMMIFTFSSVDVVLSSEKRRGWVASGSFI